MESIFDNDLKRLEILRSELESYGYYNLRVIPNQGICGLSRFIFTTGIVVGLDNMGYRGRYCYPNELVIECLVSYSVWNGIGYPIGNWIKYKGIDGEFRNPNTEKEHNIK